MSRRLWSIPLRMADLAAILGIAVLHPVFAQAQSTAQQKPAEPKIGPATAPATAPGEKAWEILRDGIKDKSADKRALAVRSLGLLTGNGEAEESAKSALHDNKANVRLAAAVALGAMHAKNAKIELEGALEDSVPSVVMAAANSLLLLHDDLAYDIYFAVLTGERRADKGLVKGQLDTLKDKKQMAKLGFDEGIGFIPFASMGYEAFKTVTKNDSSPVRAAAAKQLAHDPDPATGKALVAGTADKKWQVRAAALEAIAQRSDRSLLPMVAPALDDEKDVVRFTAAACIVYLGTLSTEKSKAKTEKP